jgi:cysteinylglycine-S-conjugate dipeptidase
VTTDWTGNVSKVMPGVVDDLTTLVAIRSCAFPGFPPEPVLEMADATVELLKRSGATNARLYDVTDGYPLVYAEVPGPPGAPTVLLYAHYDVQPAPEEQGWTTDPWEPVVKDGRLYGRGAADDKSGIAIHAATLQAFNGNPPVTLRVVVEGEEETDSHLESFVEEHPEMFTADVFVIADSGNDVVGHPIVCTDLRGAVALVVEVRTLDQAVHSGMFGGVAPDALTALIRMLATLHDDTGDVAVPGLAGGSWSGSEIDETLFREMAGVREGVALVGTGSINTRLISRPAITITGLDAPRVEGAVNAVVPVARAVVSLRIPPGSDVAGQQAILEKHLNNVVPWGVEFRILESGGGEPFSTSSDGPAIQLAMTAMEEAYGVPASQSGSGGSIPLLNTLQGLSPNGEFVIWGAEDAKQANIHSSDESVDLEELEHAVLAQVIFLDRLGQAAPNA